MNRLSKLGQPMFLLGTTLVFSMTLAAAPRPFPAQQTAPDNTKMNKGDSQPDATTADQQKMNPADRAITRKIRASIMYEKSNSTYAHNIKIITQDGTVTLKGPVRSEQEKSTVESKAAAVAGAGNVNSEIEVAPPKS